VVLVVGIYGCINRYLKTQKRRQQLSAKCALPHFEKSLSKLTIEWG
jgi:hypothetical protein